MNNNEPAFPVDSDDGSGRVTRHGMTLRDYFAAKAMMSLGTIDKKLNRDYVKESGGVVQAIAKQSYSIADAMMEARKEQSE